MRRVQMIAYIFLLLPINTYATSIRGELNLTIFLTLLLSSLPKLEQMQNLAMTLAQSIPGFSSLLLPSLAPQLIPLLHEPTDDVHSFSAELSLSANPTEDSECNSAANPVQQVSISVPLQIQIPATVEQLQSGAVCLALHGDNLQVNEQIIPQLTNYEVRQNIERGLAELNSN